MILLRAPLLLGLTVATLARSAAAQASGVPAWPRGVPNPNYSGALYLAAHITSGDDFLGDTGAEKGVTLAGRWSFGTRLTLSGGLGLAERDVAAGDRDERLHYFVSAALTPVYVQFPVEFTVSVVSGVGVTSLPGPPEEQNIPAGLSAAVSLRARGLLIDPWVDARWQWRRTTLNQGAGWQNGPGAALGVAFTWSVWSALITGDYVSLNAASTPSLPETRVLAGSLGLQYSF